MNAASTTYSMTIELEGHLIDSLTLSKVVDRLQEMGGDYRLNDIEIGSQKKDISFVSLTVTAAEEAMLDRLLEELKPYGAVNSELQEVALQTVEIGKRLSEEVYTIQAPRRVHVQGQWIEVKGGEHLVVRVNPASKTAELVDTDDLKPGDQVVAGTHGVQW